MKRFSIFLSVVILLALIALCPISTLTAPEWSVCVVDKSARPVSNVLVRESYRNYSADPAVHQQELYTDLRGCVAFPPRRAKASLIKRARAMLLAVFQGTRDELGPNSHVVAFNGNQTGTDLRAGEEFAWEGSPSEENSILVLR